MVGASTNPKKLTLKRYGCGVGGSGWTLRFCEKTKSSAFDFDLD